MNILAIIVAAIAAFIATSVYYGILGDALAKARATTGTPPDASMPPWKIGLELVRTLVIAAVVAYVITLAGVGTAGAIGLGALLWLGLSASQWSGALLWEKTPVKLAAIHAGDWLVKLVLIALVVGVWR